MAVVGRGDGKHDYTWKMSQESLADASHQYGKSRFNPSSRLCPTVEPCFTFSIIRNWSNENSEDPKSGSRTLTSSNMASDGAKVPSVSKTLISLFQSNPSNRTCADCRSASVDPSLVYASFCPSYEATRNIMADSDIGIAFHDFALNHRVFDPNAEQQADSQPPDPAKIVNQRFGGHGLFICSKCSEAHRMLGLPITQVLSIQDDSSWTQEHARCMRASGGNARSWQVYEAYMPDTWRQKRPLPSSGLEDRLMFCRAKYEALAFAMPPPGPLADLAWHAILARNATGRKYDSAELRDIFRLTPNFSGKVRGKDIDSVGILPDRLIDFFCVVSNSMELHPSLQRQDLSKLDSIDQLHFWPHIADTYPSKEAHSDMIFPLHLPSFVLPNGCVPSKRQLPPSFYTFVLTQGDGERLYGGALQIHDEHVDLEELKTAIMSTGYKGKLPEFLQENNDEEDNGESKGADIVFFPKCLVLLSHYPYFDFFRQTLLQLYRITLTESPLPVERYVSNLVSEVPLPPRGKVRVEFGFSAHKLLSIERPPFNQLPMSNFSYRPLFATMCVSNIMVVYGCLLQECRVALLSKNCSILTPIAEALLSALFPLDWQGLYIPLMPYSMLDILDAPVPFLVGLDSKYLRETPAKRRPPHVVLVDLDRDVVHLGIDEETGENRKVPYLPPRDAMKLKTRLEEAGGSIHLLPDNGMKGCVMEGSLKMQLVPNEARPKYAQMTSVTQPGDTHYREGLLKATQKAYDKYELNHNMAGFRTIQDEIKPQNNSKRAVGNGEQKRPQWRDRMPKLMKKASGTQSSLDDEDVPNLLDLSDPVGFSSSEVRNAFLRFMVTTFAHYGRYMIEDDEKDLFDETRFLRDLSYDQEATAFVGGILKTQMFQHFLEARLENPDHPEFRFFDESILAKLNRSKVTKLTKGGKLPTPFLDDTSFGIVRTYSPPPPNSVGLPVTATGYHYDKFPSLDEKLFGRVRHPMVLENQTPSRRFLSQRNESKQRKQEDIVKRALSPFGVGGFAARARQSVRDLETALRSRKLKLNGKSLKKKRSKDSLTSSGHSSEGSISDPIRKTSGNSNRTVSTLSQADTIIINARRKQSILLDEIIEIQALYRMHLAYSRYAHLRRAVVQTQRFWRKESSIRGSRSELQRKRDCAIVIQRLARQSLARREVLLRKESICILQRVMRGCLKQRSYIRQRKSAITIQRCYRGRRVCLMFHLLRHLISKVQARVRGGRVRKLTHQVFETKMTLYREQVVVLWQLSHVPLSLRTKMWPAFSVRYSFARLRLAESEIQRMWKVQGMSLPKKTVSFVDETCLEAKELGMDNSVYAHCLQQKVYPKEDQKQSELSRQLRDSYELEEAERLQVHDRLDKIKSHDVTGKIFQDFEIPLKEKMKKVNVARGIWTKPWEATISMSTMMTLFPELKGSLNIAFKSPTAKGKRRFPNAIKVKGVLPVDANLWDEVSLDGVMRKQVTEVTSTYITKVPSIMAKLDKLNDKKLGSCSAIRETLGLTSKSGIPVPKEVEMLQTFVNG